MRTDELNTNHITAEEGKVFRRISDGKLFGSEIYLGYTYYLNNELLSEPLLELPEHFEEIDDPADGEIVIIDEVMPLIEEVTEESSALKEEAPAAPVEKQLVTLADFRKLEKQVELLMKMIGGTE